MREPVLVATARINGGVDQVRRWFQDLAEHPERYQFETHGGVRFTRGDFGQAGSRFQTWEKFHGLELTLHFELVAVEDTCVRFRLIRPSFPVWGAFILGRVRSDVTELRLEVGGMSWLGAGLLRMPIVRGAVQQQIDGEVRHIKMSVETMMQGGSGEP